MADRELMSVLEVKGRWRDQPVRVVVDEYGDCTAYIGGAGRGIAKREVIGLVNPFAFQLLMEGLGRALAADPANRMLRVEGSPKWAKGGGAAASPRKDENDG